MSWSNTSVHYREREPIHAYASRCTEHHVYLSVEFGSQPDPTLFLVSFDTTTQMRAYVEALTHALTRLEIADAEHAARAAAKAVTT